MIRCQKTRRTDGRSVSINSQKHGKGGKPFNPLSNSTIFEGGGHRRVLLQDRGSAFGLKKMKWPGYLTPNRRKMTFWFRDISMYMYNCEFFFPSGTSLCARTFIRNVRWGGHNSTVGVTLPEVWARSVQCVARGKPFRLFGPWAYLRQIPGFPQHPRGWCFRIPRGLGFPHPSGNWVSASPFPVYARKIWMQTVFFARRGYTYIYISLFLHRAPRYDPAAQQQSSPLAAVAACNSMRVWLLLL